MVRTGCAIKEAACSRNKILDMCCFVNSPADVGPMNSSSAYL